MRAENVCKSSRSGRRIDFDVQMLAEQAKPYDHGTICFVSPPFVFEYGRDSCYRGDDREFSVVTPSHQLVTYSVIAGLISLSQSALLTYIKLFNWSSNCLDMESIPSWLQGSEYQRT